MDVLIQLSTRSIWHSQITYITETDSRPLPPFGARRSRSTAQVCHEVVEGGGENITPPAVYLLCQTTFEVSGSGAVNNERSFG